MNAPLRLLGITVLGIFSGIARADEQVSISALSGCSLEHPLRMGGELSVETDHFFFKNLTAGYLALLPVSHGRDPFELEPGVQGFEGLYLGVRQRFPHESFAPFVGVSVLEHMLAERPYAAVNPEVGIAFKIRERYEFFAQLRYFLTSRGRGDDFLMVSCGLARRF